MSAVRMTQAQEAAIATSRNQAATAHRMRDWPTAMVVKAVA